MCEVKSVQCLVFLSQELCLNRWALSKSKRLRDGRVLNEGKVMRNINVALLDFAQLSYVDFKMIIS
jgi:hypothetical protein